MLLLFVFSAMIQYGEAVFAEEERLPNIVLIFIDDLGYADIGPFGATEFPTPNIDQLAKSGRCFTDFVASTAVCSASRASLLTGCYHVRLGIHGAFGPRAKRESMKTK